MSVLKKKCMHVLQPLILCTQSCQLIKLSYGKYMSQGFVNVRHLHTHTDYSNPLSPHRLSHY